MKVKALESFAVLENKKIPAEWIGNPKFLNAYNFEQDKVEPLHDVFDRSSTREIKKIIDQFVQFNFKFLNLGVIDKSFNITKNYGLNDKGEVILIDIGELYDASAKIEHQREIRAWAKHYVAGCIKDIEARKYFVQEMDRCFGL